MSNVGYAAATIPGTSVPHVVPGTSTRYDELRQARRWLGNERRLDPRRFEKPAIEEVDNLFHIDAEIRANHPFHAMSQEAKRIVTTLEDERASAVRSGNSGDWWDGPERKGVTKADQKAYKAAMEMAKAMKNGNSETMGLEVDDEDVLAEAVGAISSEGPEFNGWTFEDVGFESSNESLADEVEEDFNKMDIRKG